MSLRSVLSLFCAAAALSWTLGCARAERTLNARPPAKAPASQPSAVSSKPPVAAVSAKPAKPAKIAATTRASKSAPADGVSKKAAPAQPRPASAEQLRRAVADVLASGPLAKAHVSVLVAPLAGGAPIVSHQAEKPRVPASNAKLLTTTAAALGLGGYRFVTEFAKRGSRVYVWGSGDPLLRGREIDAIAKQLKARGVRRVSEVVVDASHFDKRQLAPGFSAFHEGSYYRPTSSALNIDGNAVVIRISAPKTRRRPRVDVTPPSDYVKVRKRLRYLRTRRRRRRRRARARGKERISIQMRKRGSIMWLEIKGAIRRGARTRTTRRAVYDPALNVGWALRRALKKVGVGVRGIVRRGRRPRGARVLVRKARSLGAILRVTNQASDNLAAETLVRALGVYGEKHQGRRAVDSWKRGLARLHALLRSRLGVDGVALKNGSGLHRSSHVSARALVKLLRAVYQREGLRRALLPTLPIAGKTGTLGHRMRGTAAAGAVRAKTGTLGGALSLSGYAGLGSKRPLVFSVLVNGTGRRAARRQIDRIAVLMARYAKGMPLYDAAEPAPQSNPTTPASKPSAAIRPVGPRPLATHSR
ncbi:MAG: D-alanyl-D-alanine carboxypeptidase/D-alanyl-D-alanine-endopeptidase [Myxococcales bacterium]|nr:D-alanyl-D-alanine carboxypeptidase/D-alanyl-D-alanine-endopeptidase [Myxococcales bacterium]